MKKSDKFILVGFSLFFFPIFLMLIWLFCNTFATGKFFFPQGYYEKYFSRYSSNNIKYQIDDVELEVHLSGQKFYGAIPLWINFFYDTGPYHISILLPNLLTSDNTVLLHSIKYESVQGSTKVVSLLEKPQFVLKEYYSRDPSDTYFFWHSDFTLDLNIWEGRNKKLIFDVEIEGKKGSKRAIVEVPLDWEFDCSCLMYWP